MKMKQRLLMWGPAFLILVMGVARGELVATLPAVEDFHSGELPHDQYIPLPPPLYGYWQTSPWSFTTNGEARTEIAFDETDMVTQWVPQAILSPSSNTGGNRSKGQYYACNQSGALVSNGINLNRDGPLNVTFFVYESAVSNGTYTLIHSDTVAAAAGNNVVRSGAAKIPMDKGKYYLIGAGWDGPATYTYKTSGYIPSTFPLGYTLAGYSINTSSPPSSVTGSLSTQTAYPQELVFSTNAVVRMDDAVDNSTLSTNQMDLAVNLLGYAEVTLAFRHRESNDENNGDAILLSDDNGAHFTKVYDLDPASSTWQTVRLDIFNLAISHGLAPNENFVIRFQQVDNYGWPTDGREFDDIRLFSKPDLDMTYLSVAHEFLWKGFDSDKSVPMSATVWTRGGETNLSVPSVRFRYGFSDDPVTVSNYEYTTSAWDFPALEKSSQPLSHTLTIPAATHLPDLYYNCSIVADSLDAVDEGNNANNILTEQVMVNHYSGNLWFDDVVTDITITDWGTRVADSPTEHWITGTGTLNGESFSFTNLKVVKDLTTLDYSLDPTETTRINVPFTDPDEINNVTYKRIGGVNLSKAGAYANIQVLLPAGMGVSTNSQTILDPMVTFPNTKLSQELCPPGPVHITGDMYMAEETKPLVFDVSSLAWNPQAGTFSFGRNGVQFVREAQLASLESNKALLVDQDMAVKKSNASYYRGVTSLDSDPQVEAGVNGAALLSADLSLDPVKMTTHFPYGVVQEWQNQSTIEITRDLIDGSVSELKNPTNMAISYARDCAGVECAGSAGPATIAMRPQKNTDPSIDGGLRTPVDILSGGDLKWGTRWDGKFAQQAGPFTEGTFYMPGHFIRGDQSAFDASQMYGPAEILLSGMAARMERPSKSNYANGLADYAGLNLRVETDSALQAESIVGGEGSGQWPLTGRSKYYIRHSGVSGIHEAFSFPSSMTIYGYPFEFSNYGLSYLSGKPQESRINGGVSVPDPCDVAMSFKNLMLDCLGELGEAELADSDTKTLAYWDADIQPLTLFFAPTDSSTCGNQARKLCMGLTTRCANIDQTLSGILGFLPTGELAAPSDKIEGVPSRLVSPNKIKLDGPGDETYYFTPVANPYYNSYSQSGDSMSERGWINVAGNLDVSFFNDLQVHFQTSASTNSAVANIYMMGGWKEDGASFFNSGPDSFDTHNSGFPAGTITYADYRTSTNSEYQVHALRNWLGVIDFDYPLEWSTATKSFKSPSELEEDLLVVQVQHKTDYLSAKRTEISFGAQYDGVPQINLANMAFNAVDKETGMLSAFSNAVGDEIHSAIDDGMSAFNDTLCDLPEKLLDPVFDEVLDPVVDEFYTDLYNAYQTQPTNTDFGSVVTQYLYGVAGPAYDNVGNTLSNLADTAAGAVNLLDQIDGNLDQAVQLINAFADAVSMTNGVALPADVPGLLSQVGGKYATMADLGTGILSTLAEDLYGSISGTIQDEINSALEAAAPSLESITQVLLDLRDVIIDVQTQLDAAGSMATELSDVLHSPLVLDTLDTISAEIMKQLDSLSLGDSSFAEYTPEEVKAMLRRMITDAFYGSEPCADLQQVIRSRLYEVEASVQESIDSVFQQLNTAMKDLVSQYLAGIDEKINGALGDLSDTLGAGQLEGYAHIRGDSLDELRIDGKFQWKVPDETEFNAHLLIKDMNSSMPGGCGVDADSLPEVTLGTTDMGLSMLGSDIRADISTKFAFAENAGTLRLIGMGGSFDMTEGEIGFESFAIDDFYAAVAFGALENYLSANIHCTFTSYEVEGGIFLGKTCSLDPFSWDPDVQSVLGDPPFTGIYAYGEGWMPIVDFGCLFRIKAGVGAGVFYFVNGPVGGKIFLGADGEALCVVNVAGDVTLVGLKDGDDMRMAGKGKISGRAGACPFCVKFSKTVTINYDNGDWDVDY